MVVDGISTASAAFALIQLIPTLCNKCKQASGSFDELQDDLSSLHTVLQAVCEILPEGGNLGPIQTGCEKIATDIGKLISKYESLGSTRKGWWQTIGWQFSGAEEVAQLRSRLTAQVTMLGVLATAANSHTPRSSSTRTLHHDGQNGPSRTPSDEAKIWNDIEEQLRAQGTSETLIEVLRQMILQRPVSADTNESTISLPASTSTSASTSPLISLASSESPKRPPSISSSSASTSPLLSILSEKEKFDPTTPPTIPHSLPSPGSKTGKSFKSLFSRTSHNFIAAAEGGDLITVTKLHRKIKESDRACTLNRALLALCENETHSREQVGVLEFLLGLEETVVECQDGKHLRTPLILAISSSRLDLVKELVSSEKGGASLSSRDSIRDFPPLTWAAYWGNEGILRFLLDREADMKAKDGLKGRTALAWACERGNAGAVACLINHEAAEGDILDERDGEGMSPLAVAYMGGHLAAAKVLLEHGVKPNFEFPTEPHNNLLVSTLLTPSKKFHMFSQLFLSFGANANSVELMTGTPALILAIESEDPDLEVVKSLLDKGAEIEAEDEQGRTPLLQAVWAGWRGCVRELLARGAVVGRSVLDMAEVVGDEGIIEMLGGRMGTG